MLKLRKALECPPFFPSIIKISGVLISLTGILAACAMDRAPERLAASPARYPVQPHSLQTQPMEQWTADPSQPYRSGERSPYLPPSDSGPLPLPNPPSTKPDQSGLAEEPYRTAAGELTSQASSSTPAPSLAESGWRVITDPVPTSEIQGRVAITGTDRTHIRLACYRYRDFGFLRLGITDASLGETFPQDLDMQLTIDGQTSVTPHFFRHHGHLFETMWLTPGFLNALAAGQTIEISAPDQNRRLAQYSLQGSAPAITQIVNYCNQQNLRR